MLVQKGEKKCEDLLKNIYLNRTQSDFQTSQLESSKMEKNAWTFNTNYPAQATPNVQGDASNQNNKVDAPNWMNKQGDGGNTLPWLNKQPVQAPAASFT